MPTILWKSLNHHIHSTHYLFFSTTTNLTGFSHRQTWIVWFDNIPQAVSDCIITDVVIRDTWAFKMNPITRKHNLTRDITKQVQETARPSGDPPAHLPLGIPKVFHPFFEQRNFKPRKNLVKDIKCVHRK